MIKITLEIETYDEVDQLSNQLSNFNFLVSCISDALAPIHLTAKFTDENNVEHTTILGDR